MTHRLNLRTLFAAGLAAAAVAAGFGGLSADRAEAHPDVRTTLTITPDPRAFFQAVQIKGYVAMSRVEAQRQIDNGVNVFWSVYGDDPIRPDYLDGPNIVDAKDLRASSRGLEYRATRVLANSRLNEDWGGDEIYAGVSISNYRPGFRFHRSGGTNRVHGNF